METALLAKTKYWPAGKWICQACKARLPPWIDYDKDKDKGGGKDDGKDSGGGGGGKDCTAMEVD